MRTKIRTETSGTFSFQEHAEGTKGSLEKEGTLRGEGPRRAGERGEEAAADHSGAGASDEPIRHCLMN